MGFRRPILAFAGNLVDSLSAAFDMKRVKVKEPGLVIYAMDGRTNDTRVIVRPETRGNGSRVVKIFLPSPGYSDLDELRMGVSAVITKPDMRIVKMRQRVKQIFRRIDVFKGDLYPHLFRIFYYGFQSLNAKLEARLL